MMTLKDALRASPSELSALKEEMLQAIQSSTLNAYVRTQSIAQGAPIAIKDNIQVDGWAVTAASNILQGYVAPYNATVIEKLLAANCSLFGQTNMDEFAMGSTTQTSCYGKTYNPRNSACVPGGSSGGSAAAVAGGLAVAALGSDTGGSIRQPAAFCGIVGMKPTYGRVSRYGLGAYASSLDQIGPMTQNVEDAAILYDIISGHDEKDSTSYAGEYEAVAPNLDASKQYTIATVPTFLNGASQDIIQAYNRVVEQLKSLGHKIVEVSMMDAKYDISAYYITATAEATTNLARYDGIRYGKRARGNNLQETFINSRSEGFGDEVKRRVLLGNFVLSSGYYDAYYVKAQKVRQLIKNEYDTIFKQADLILSPVAPRTAFTFDAIHSPLEMYLSDLYTISVNLAGLPALSLPVGESQEGMPVGLQLIAAPFKEQTLFNAALGLEEIIKKG